MSPTTDDPVAEGVSASASQFEHETCESETRGDADCRVDYGSRGDYGCRGDYGKRGDYGTHGDRAMRSDYGLRGDRRHDGRSDSSDRRRQMMRSSERRGSFVDLKMKMERDVSHGSHREGYGQFRGMEGSQGYRGRGRENYYGGMDRFDSGPFGRYGSSRDYSPYGYGGRFESGPYGKSGYGNDFDRYGYRRDYGNRSGYGGDYSRSGNYKSHYGYPGHGYGNYNDRYGQHGNYRNTYGTGYGMGYTRGYGEGYGNNYSPRMYGYGSGHGEYSGHGYGGYNRSHSSFRNPYGYDRHVYGGSYGDHGRHGYGGYSRYSSCDRSPYTHDRYGYGGSYDRYGSNFGRDGYRGRSHERTVYGYDSHKPQDFYSYNRYNKRDFSAKRDYSTNRNEMHKHNDQNPYETSYSGTYGQPRTSEYTYNRPGQHSSDHHRGDYPSHDYGRSMFGNLSYDQDKLSYMGRGKQGYNSYPQRYGGSQYRNQQGYGGHQGYGGYQGYGGQQGYGGYQGNRGNQYGSGGYQSQYGRNQYRCKPYEGRSSSYARRHFDDGYQYGSPMDHSGMPPLFPLFSQSRSYYPTSSEFHEDEETFGKLRTSRAKEMAVRANFDLQRRKFYENTTDPTQNINFKVPPSRHGGPPHFPYDSLRVQFVDFLPLVNAKEHRTLNYELVHCAKPSAIFRRGQSFFMDITFQNRDFNPNRDCLFLNFYLGPNPSSPKKTRIVLPVTMQKEFQKVPQQWDIRLQNQESGKLTLEIRIPSTAAVGCWQCVIETAFRHFKKARLQFRPPMNMYIIFNPFSHDDSTYLDNDDLRTEYLMNDNGKIFLGGFKSAKGRPWVYGQFDDCVLPAVCVLLEMSKLSHSEWGNPAKVTRAISSMIKAGRSGHHDSPPFGKSEGVLVPQYEEDFRGGSSPHLWTGSVQIIEEFLRGGASPVKFGHCWVMAAVMTTFCRAIGLPARPVTAFVAAMNTQESMTVDKYVDKFGELLERGPCRDQPDSLWSFHTWCEIWMMRPDLPLGHSGWQACDPSRSNRNNAERLSGACGPCSSLAIRKGDLGFQKDTDVFYSILNSYVRYFYENDQSEWGFLPFNQFRFPVGRYILTKSASGTDDEGDADFEDITCLYKDPDMPDQERVSVYNAFRGRNRDAFEFDLSAMSSSYGPFPSITKEGKDAEVFFEFQEPVRVMLGEPVTFTFSIHNPSQSLKTIQANISCRSVFYTGIVGPHVKRIAGQFTLKSDETEKLTLRIDPLEYQEKLMDMSFIKTTVTGFVRETMQSFVEEFDFKFDKPKLVIQMPEESVKGEDCPFELTFTNPLGMTLTECFVTFEVNGSVRPKTIQIETEVAPREQFQFRHSFTSRRQGMRHLVACFSSKQLSDVNGRKKILINA